MGSYLSIHNNTPHTAYVTLTHDTEACKIACICFGVAGAVAGAAGFAIAISGFAAGTISALSNFAVGLPAAAVAIPAVGAGLVVGGAAAGAASLAFQVGAQLEAQGAIKLLPGQSHTWGRFTLSFWRQGNVTLLYINPNNPKQVVQDCTVMRPIFSGATDGSTRTHDIQWWINKWGVSRQTMTES